MLDFKGVEFNCYRGFKHTRAILVDRADERITYEVIKDIKLKMEERQQLLAAAGASDVSEYNKMNANKHLTQIILVADECQTLFADRAKNGRLQNEMVDIIATAADGSNVSGQSLLGIFDADWEEPVYGTAIAVEGGVTEITMTKSQSAKLVNLVVTPENYNGGISAMHGPLRVNPCGEGEKTLPAFYIQPEMGVTCPYTDTVVFMMNSVDPHGSHIMPRCTLVVKVTEDIIFTAKTIEGVDMTFRVTDPEAMTCEVYGYMEQLMQPDPVTHEPFIMHTAVDASTTGKITVPAVAKGCTVTPVYQDGCLPRVLRIAETHPAEEHQGSEHVGRYAATG